MEGMGAVGVNTAHEGEEDRDPCWVDQEEGSHGRVDGSLSTLDHLGNHQEESEGTNCVLVTPQVTVKIVSVYTKLSTPALV